MQELAMEYRETADKLLDRLYRLREELRTARGEQAFSLQRRIECIRCELVQVRQIMGYLLQYYAE